MNWAAIALMLMIPADAPELRGIETNLLGYTNAERRLHRLPELKLDAALMRSARSHCAWMARYGSMTHGTRAAGVAENIATGQAHSQAVLRTWMKSAGHRANILQPGHVRLGVAAYRSSSGRIYWCQHFRR